MYIISKFKNHYRLTSLTIDQLLTITIIIFLISTIFLLGIYLRPNLLDVIWDADDVNHISVALSFQENKSFDTLYWPEYNHKSTIEETIEKLPTIAWPYNDKGPIYYVLLGSFFKIAGANPENFYFFGSLFNNLLSSIFISIFFLFVKKKFNLKIAFFSSLLVIFNPWFAWESSRVLLYSLLMIFSISALFFLEKTRTHYIIFGIFAGLSHLVHPFGIFLGFSYSIFLLLNREFKGFIITVVTWHLVLLPWLFRNYYFFQDIGWGLYLPFSSKISALISFLPHKQTSFAGPTDYLPTESINEILTLKIFTIFSQIFKWTSETYSIDYLIIFVIAFSGFAFFKLGKLKTTVKYILPALVIFYILTYFINNSYVQLFYIYIIPIISILVLFKIRKSLFKTPIPRINSFIIFFVLISLFGIFITTLIYNQMSPPKQYIFSLFLAIPLAIVGLDKLIRFIIQGRSTSLRKAMSIIIIALVILPITIHLAYGIEPINNYYIDKDYPHHNDETRIVNEWIRHNIQNESLASNLPADTFLRTGLQTISFPPYEISEKDFHKLIDNYQISYLIFYDLSKFDSKFYGQLKSWPLNEYIYTEIFHTENSQVLKVVNLSTVEISHPQAYFKKAIKLEWDGKREESSKIFDELRNYETDEKLIDEELCMSFTYYKIFEKSIYKCNLLLKKDSANLVALNNLAISLVNTDQKDKVNEILDQYDKIIEESNDEQILKSWGETVDYLIQFDSSYYEIKNNLVLDAKTLEEQGDLQRALRVLEQMKYVDAISLPAHESKISVLTKLEKYEEALEEYDLTIKIYQDKIEKLQSSGSVNLAYAMEKPLINVMKGKATLLLTLDDHHKAFRVYNEIMALDKFDVEVHKGLGSYFEKYDNFIQALQEYEFALIFQPNNEFLQNKVKELKTKL